MEANGKEGGAKARTRKQDNNSMHSEHLNTSLGVKENMGRDILPTLVSQRVGKDHSSLLILLGHILESFREIGTKIRDNAFSCTKLGTENIFGDSQLEVDVKCDEALFSALRSAKNVHVAASEESPNEISCGAICNKSSGYSVCFDPLDGSSIIDSNFAVGTVLGIWPGVGIVGRKGNEQCASAVCVYGPRVTAVVAFNSRSTKSGVPFCVELTMETDRWALTKENISIAHKAKTFGPGNLRATADNEKYMALVQFWLANKYTLRYSGGMVPDIYHILAKGEGIFTNASSPTAEAKLRLAFEACPFALIVEACGGATCVSAAEEAEDVEPVSLLDVLISDIDKRVGVAMGSVEEVERFKEYLFGTYEKRL